MSGYFDHETFAKKYGISKNWIFDGFLPEHPRGLKRQQPRRSKNGTPEERAATAMPTAATVIEISRRDVSRAAARPVLSSDEFVAKMACLDQDARQVIIDYMNLLLAKRST